MSLDDNETNGRPGDDEDENEELEEETEDESEEHVSVEIAERDGGLEHRKEKRPKPARTTG